jgi:hypothetical protein
MKFVVLLALAFVAVSARPADQEVDWSSVFPLRDLLRVDAAHVGPTFEEPTVQRDRRIVNGEKAEPHQFPYQVCWK